MSEIIWRGLVGLSSQTILVLGPTAALTASKSPVSIRLWKTLKVVSFITSTSSRNSGVIKDSEFMFYILFGMAGYKRSQRSPPVQEFQYPNLWITELFAHTQQGTQKLGKDDIELYLLDYQTGLWRYSREKAI